MRRFSRKLALVAVSLSLFGGGSAYARGPSFASGIHRMQHHLHRHPAQTAPAKTTRPHNKRAPSRGVDRAR